MTSNSLEELKSKIIHLHQQAENHLGKGEWEAAISCYQQAITLSPNTWQLHFQLGEIHRQQQNWQAAAACYQQAIQLNPKSFWSHHHLGDSFLKQNQWQAAIPIYQKAIQLNPNYSWSYNNLGVALMQCQQWEAAADAFRQAIALKPDYPWSYSSLGEVLLKQHRYQEAVEVLQTATQLNPDYPWSYNSLGNALLQLHRYEEAVTALQTATQLNPEYPWSYYNLGQALMALQRCTEAIAAFHNSIQYNRDFRWSYNHIKNILFRQGKLEEAIAFFQQLTQESPQTFWSHFYLKWLILKQGEAAREAGNEAAATEKFHTAKHIQLVDPAANVSDDDTSRFGNPQPDFLILGTQKGGTSSLYHYLATHPQVLPAVEKEIDFWGWNYTRGIDWYLAHFSPIPSDSQKITGEATPQYLEYTHAATQISQYFPDIKFLILLRNPADRTISQYYHWVGEGSETRPLSEVVDAEIELLLQQPEDVIGNKAYWDLPIKYLGRSIYIEFLRCWMQVFSRDQFLIVRSEDFFQNPDAMLQEVCRFLGLSEHHLPHYEQHNRGSYEGVDAAARQRLLDFFDGYNRQLEAFLDRSLDW